MLTLKFACPSFMQTHEVQQWRISSETARCKSGETYYDFYCPKSGCNHHVGWFGPVDASNPFETLKPDNVRGRAASQIEALKERIAKIDAVLATGHKFY